LGLYRNRVGKLSGRRDGQYGAGRTTDHALSVTLPRMASKAPCRPSVAMTITSVLFAASRMIDHIAAAPRLFPGTCVALRVVELRKGAAIGMKGHDFHDIVTQSLGAAAARNLRNGRLERKRQAALAARGEDG
jgi:hypothetical protein